MLTIFRLLKGQSSNSKVIVLHDALVTGLVRTERWTVGHNVSSLGTGVFQWSFQIRIGPCYQLVSVEVQTVGKIVCRHKSSTQSPMEFKGGDSTLGSVLCEDDGLSSALNFFEIQTLAWWTMWGLVLRWKFPRVKLEIAVVGPDSLKW